jgi:hypothetical protein
LSPYRSGKVNNIEYVKGLTLRCPANLSTNAADLGTGVKGALYLASDVTLDLVFGDGAWSKAVRFFSFPAQAAALSNFQSFPSPAWCLVKHGVKKL